MKMKRLISMLLTAAIACSCLPITLSATAEDTKAMTADDGWMSSAYDLTFIEENVDFATALRAASPSNGAFTLGYNNDNFVEEFDADAIGSTYRFSLWLRVAPGTAPSDTYSQFAVVTLGGPYGGHCTLSQLGCHDDWGGAVTVKSISQPSDKSHCLQIGQEWQEYVIDFEVGMDLSAINTNQYDLKQYGIRFILYGDYNEDAANRQFAPIDIGGMSLVKLDADGNVAPGSEVIENSGWYAKDFLTIKAAELSNFNIVDGYYRANAVNGVNTVVHSASDEVLEMGIYSISGNFRASSAAALTVSVGDETSEAANISTSWATQTVTLDIKKNTAISDIEFALDGSYTFDFADISFTKTADYTTAYTFLDGEPTLKASESFDFTTAMRAASPANSGFNFGYKNDSFVEEFDADAIGSTYRLSLWLRVAPGTAPSDTYSQFALLTFGGQYGGHCVLSQLGCNDDWGGAVTVKSISQPSDRYNCLQIGQEWQEYVIDFEVGMDLAAIDTNEYDLATYGLKFTMYGDYNEDAASRNFAPIDIGGMSLVKLDADGNAVAGSEIIDGGEWYAKDFLTIKAAELDDFEVLTDFYRAEPRDGEATAITFGSDTELPMGVYSLNASFRSDDAANLTVSVNGEESDPLALTSQWVNGEITVELKSATKLSNINIMLDGSHTLDFSDITLEKIADYTLDYKYINGDPVIETSENFSFVSYVRAASPANSGFNFGYKNDSFVEEFDADAIGSTYRLSMWLRVAPGTAPSDSYSQFALLTFGGQYSAHCPLSQLGCNDDWGGAVTVKSISQPSDRYNCLQIKQEWQEYVIDFEVGMDLAAINTNEYDLATYGLKFTMYGDYNEDAASRNFTPIDIGGMSLVKLDADGNAVDGSEIIDGGEWYAKDFLTIKAAELDDFEVITNFYRAEAKNGENTAITFGSDTELPMGVYSLNASFRSDAAANLTVSAGTEESEPLAITDYWVDGSLTIRLKEATKLSDIHLTLDGSHTLDFTGIVIEQLASYIDEWSTGTGDPVAKIGENIDLDFTTALRVTSTSGTFNFGYKSNKLTEEFDADAIGSTYRLSMWMRVAPSTAPSADYSQYASLNLGGPYSGHCLLSKLGWDGDWGDAVYVKSISQPTDKNNYLQIGEEWQEYVIEFEVGRDLAAIDENYYSLAKYGIRFSFLGANTAFAPIDIGGVSLVKLDADGNAVPDSEIIGNDGTWYSDNELVSAKAEIGDCDSLGNEYYRAEGVTGTNTAIIPGSTDALEKGLYHITGNFRVGPDADAAADFSASLGGAVLKTLKGEQSISLTSGWSSVTFVIDVAVDGYSMNDIMLMIDSDIDLEFSSVSIEQLERYVQLSDVNVGSVMTILMLLKAHEEGRPPIRDYDGERVELPVDEMQFAPVEGNLMRSSDLTRRKNWIYGDQTLAFRYDDEGILNITAKDITSNKAGFTFAPNVALRPGAYRFTGEFRTANEGEETVLRVYVAGKMFLFLATNEWTPIDVMFEVNEKTPITFTVKNGPDAYYTQPYEMRKLNITDFATAPFDVELETGGDFESESSMNRWSTSSGAGDIERVTEDGNSFLRNTNRTVCYAGVNYALDANIIQGVAYKVTYDIRTSNPGDTMTARAHYYEGNNTSNTDLLIYGEASNSAGNEFEINNEWLHVESVFVASLTGKFRFGINGGQDEAEDIKPFDIDNFKVIRLNYGERPGEYNDGDFEDPIMALLRWAPESDAGRVTHVVEDGNGFIRKTGHTLAYRSILVSPGLNIKKGDTIKITYDVRTSNPGEESVLRSNVRIGNSGIVDVPITSGALDNARIQYAVNNEWRHVETLYTSTYEGALKFGICGGPYSHYIQDIDIDNLTIEIVD